MANTVKFKTDTIRGVWILEADGFEVPIIKTDFTHGRHREELDEPIKSWMKEWLPQLTSLEGAALLGICDKSALKLRRSLGIEPNKSRRKLYRPDISEERKKILLMKLEQGREKIALRAKANKQKKMEEKMMLQEKKAQQKEVKELQDMVRKERLKAKKENRESIFPTLYPTPTNPKRREFVQPSSKCISNCWLRNRGKCNPYSKNTCPFDLDEWRTNGISYPQKVNDDKRIIR